MPTFRPTGRPQSLSRQVAQERVRVADNDRIEGQMLHEARRGSGLGPSGAEPAGTAASFMAVHLADPDPHPQYASDADVAAASTADRNRANHTGTQTASTISDFLSTVLGSLLTGLGAGTNAAIAAGDTLLAALAKLQAQVTARVPTTRTISTTAPLAGGGDMSANRTFTISAATTSAAGSMSAADKTKLDTVTGGTYTPVVTAILNSPVATAGVCRWVRNGNTVTVYGGFSCTPTMGVLTRTRHSVSLPVAPVFAAATQAVVTGGAVVSTDSSYVYGFARNNPTNDVVVDFLAPMAAATAIYFQITYGIA